MFNWFNNNMFHWLAKNKNVIILLSCMILFALFIYFMGMEFIIFSGIFFGIVLFGLAIFMLLKKGYLKNIKCYGTISIYIVVVLLIGSFVLSHILVENSQEEEPTKNTISTEGKPVKNENAVNEKTIQNDIITRVATLAKPIVETTAQISIVTLFVVFFGFGFYACFCSKIKAKSDTEKTKTFPISSALLIRLLIVSLASSTIPTGVSLILCAFFESIKVEQMTGHEIYLAYAGLSLIFMTLIVILEEKQRIDDLWKSFKNNSENEKVNKKS